jgi:hypothetical protein
MRLRASAILAWVTLAGCAANPQHLCAPNAPNTWQYIGKDEGLSALLKDSLPHAPYSTNEGKPVRAVQQVWFRVGDHQLLACTLARHARDNCSVRTTEFILIDGAWSKRSEDAVLCNVLASTHNKSLERTRGR